MSTFPPAVPGGAGSLAVRADLVRAAALAVPGVVRLHGGALGEVAVHLPGRRVSGVRLRDGRTQVHVVVALGAPVRSTAQAVRAAVAAVVPEQPVDVTVEDVAAPDETPHPAEPAARP